MILQRFVPPPLARLFYSSLKIQVNLQKLIEMKIVPVSEDANCVLWIAIDHTVEMERSFASICKFISVFLL